MTYIGYLNSQAVEQLTEFFKEKPNAQAFFANLAVDAVLRLRGSTDLEHIQIIKKVGGKLTDSYLDEGAYAHTHHTLHADFGRGL